MKSTLLKTALFLVSAVLAMTACASSEPESFDIPEYDVSAGESIDLEGFNMKYALCAATIYGDTSAENILGYVPNTTFGDLAAARKAKVEKDFNCNIEPFYAEDGASVDQFKLYSATGSFYCDAIQSTSEWLIDLAISGSLVGMTTVSDYIDYLDADKWGKSSMLESMCYVDDLYGVAPMAWPELCYTTVGYPIVFNADLIRTIGQQDLREYKETNTWTWKTFEQVLETCTVVENGETKIYAMEVHPPYFAEMFFRSNGSFLVIPDGGEGYDCGYYHDDKAVEAINETYQLYQGRFKNCFKKSNDGAPDDVIQDFVDELVAMTACDTEHLYGLNAKISMNMENFGIMPWPTGPSVEPGYTFSVHEALRFAISISTFSNDIDATAIILNAIYEPFEEYATFEDIKEHMMHNYFFDSRDADTFFDMFDNTYYNYFHFGARDLAYYLPDSLQDANSTMLSYEDIMETVVDEDITPMKKAVSLLWGED